MRVKEKGPIALFVSIIYLLRIVYLYYQGGLSNSQDINGLLVIIAVWLVPCSMVVFPYHFATFISLTPRGMGTADAMKPENSAAAFKFLGCVGIGLLIWMFETSA